jgi:hypothetical protein
MARKMKKFSAGGAQGRYDRRMADIEKDFAKDSKGKSGKALEVLEAKRAQRTADAKDDLAKRTGADRTATRAAERLAERNLTKTRKYGAPQMVSKFEPVASEKITETLSLPKPGLATSTKKATPTAAKTPVRVDRAPTVSKRTGDQGFASKSKTTGGRPAMAAIREDAAAHMKGKSGDTKTDTKTSKPKVSAALLAPKGSTSRSGSLFGTIFKTSDAFKKSQEAKYGKAKGGKIMKYAKGGSTSSKPPQPSAADRARSKKHLAELKKLKVTPENAAAIGRGNRSTGMAKGGKMAPKFGAAMKKKSADTKGRAMMKKAGGGKCYASGGLVAGHKSADGIAKKGKTKGKMPTMARGGAAMMRSRDSYGGANFKKGGKC